MDVQDIDLKTWRRCEKIRSLYERYPVSYRLKLVLILLHGLLSLGLLIVLILLLSVFGWAFVKLLDITALTLLILAAVAAIFCARWLFRRDYRDIPGFLLKTDRCERLYEEVGKICSELGIPPILDIYLDMSMNVTVLPRYRRLPLVKRNVLTIGYPLICALDSTSFRICLTRVLWHEKAQSRDRLLKWIERVWALPPVIYNPDTGEVEGIDHIPKMFGLNFLPLRAKEARDAESYCRDAFGAKNYAAFVTQARFPSERFEFNTGDLLLQFYIEGDSDKDFAAFLRDEMRRIPPEAETKRILGQMLRSTEPVTETLPAFRESVGTNDPAELLPYLDRTPDAAEKILFDKPEFEAELKDYLNLLPCDDEKDFKDTIRQLRKETTFDEKSGDPNVWADAMETAMHLTHENRLLDILEKAVKKFPDDPSFRGFLLARRMRYAATAQEESEAAGKLMRIAEQGPMLALTFHDELIDYAIRRGDSELVEQLLEERESARKATRKMFSAGLDMDDLLEPYKKFSFMRKSIRELLSFGFLGVERVYFVTRRYRGSSLIVSRFVYLKRSKLKMFLSGPGYPEEFAEYMKDTPFHEVRIAGKKDLKVLEAKHIPFLKVKPQ